MKLLSLKLKSSVLALCVASQAPAQGAITVSSSGRDFTPAEQSRSLSLYEGVVFPRESERFVLHRYDVADELDTALAVRARHWISSLQAARAKGLQLDPMGKIYISAGQDVLAKQQFAARLATPNLSVQDSAYTLLLATTAFGNKADNAIRMSEALGYLAKLDALPASVAVVSQHTGPVEIARSYYMVGNGQEAIKHFKLAFARVPDIPYERRNWLSFRYTFLMLADALSGLPDGRKQIDSLTAWLRPYAEASPSLIAKNPGYANFLNGNMIQYREMVQMTNYLGRRAPDIVAHYWFNTPVPSTASTEAPGATVKALNDGKIRVMEFGHFGCPGCLSALLEIDRLREVVPPNVEMWYVTNESDVWGAEWQSSEAIAQHLKHFYLDTKGYKVPISIWVGPRQTDVDGGSTTRECPTTASYKFFGTPTFVITDGNGIVRHISFTFDRDLLMRSVRYLAAESKVVSAQ